MVPKDGCDQATHQTAESWPVSVAVKWWVGGFAAAELVVDVVDGGSME